METSRTRTFIYYKIDSMKFFITLLFLPFFSIAQQLVPSSYTIISSGSNEGLYL